jgi:glutamate-1-semialdehyde 2,1-aminomutase
MTKSELYLEKARTRIPWGTQTNAKRPITEYAGVMPYFIERGKGCRLWDIDGREFIDYRISLGPVTLGYCYDEVDDAVRKQLDKGVLFSMASPIEYELAELMSEFVKSAEMTRFMKTGEEANTCALRIARTVTGKDLFVTCGYHGYPDWFQTNLQNNGVPAVLKNYVIDIPWGDLETAEKVIRENADKISCLITIPYDFNENIKPDFLKLLRKLTTEYGILLIFDEVLTGFRLAPGGGQEYFGVEPDLSAFAKAMANGYPISAYSGKKEIMSRHEDIFITTTYAGETLSIAASIATLKIMKREKVHDHLNKMGYRLMDGLREIFKRLNIEGSIEGLPVSAINKFSYNDEEFNKKLDFIFQRELFREGIFFSGRWYLCYSHKEKDIDETLEKAEKALKNSLNICLSK